MRSAKISDWVSPVIFFARFLALLFMLSVERPIRNFELLFDVSSSWDKDKSQNMFMLKKTALAIPLGVSLFRIECLSFALMSCYH